MIYRIEQIKLKLNEDENLLEKKIRQKIGNVDIADLRIVKKSIDARNKDDIKIIYSIDFACNKKLKLPLAPDLTYKAITKDTSWNNRKRPIVVGFGPAGMFASLVLAQAGLNPIVIERGSEVDKRLEKVKAFWEKGILDTESNVQFGEGGAGTFSDGKLTTGIKDMRIRKVLSEFVNHGAHEEILYDAKPHIGTDVLRNVVRGIREEIRSLGGDVFFDSKVTKIKSKDGKLTSVIYENGGKEYELETDSAIFAIGHSARDTFRYLNSIGINMSQKPFSIGVRIEHPQDVIDISQYGKPARDLGLPVAPYKINYMTKSGRGVYTFCMCPGGEVIVASSEKDMVVTNGMSNYKRDSGKANSALLVDVRTDDFESDSPLAGIDFQEKYEKLAFINGGSSYKAPKTTWKEFRDGNGKTVENSLPEFAVSAIKEAMPFLGKKIHGFDDDNAVLYGTETRSSSPVRIHRDDTFNGDIKGFYPVGEGAGYAGGIVSAAVDGIKVAEHIIKSKE